jgi:hypothetical protein
MPLSPRSAPSPARQRHAAQQAIAQTAHQKRNKRLSAVLRLIPPLRAMTQLLQWMGHLFIAPPNLAVSRLFRKADRGPGRVP